MACHIVNLVFLAVLQRPAEPAAIDYWAAVEQREGSVAMVDHVMHQPEAVGRDAIELWYPFLLGRPADPGGLAYWRRQPNAAAFVAIASSPEAGGCAPVPAPLPPGWVDSGNGVPIPAVLAAIRWCESTDNYLARNPASTAAGAFQMIEGTARGVAKAMGRPDLIGWGDNVAGSWSPADQDAAAVALWQQQGTRPWAASRSCWAR